MTGVGFPGANDLFTAIGRPRASPSTSRSATGWCADWHDPWNFIRLCATERRSTTVRTTSTTRTSTIPSSTTRMHAASELTDDGALRRLRADRARSRPRRCPLAASWRLYGNREFFSRRIGCQLYQHVYQGIDLVQLCLRPEITTDDASVLEPAFGTTTVPITVHLSSEMDDTVSRSPMQPQDGTAHSGDDYVATSGTLTFAPNQRVRHRRRHRSTPTSTASRPRPSRSTSRTRAAARSSTRRRS